MNPDYELDPLDPEDEITAELNGPPALVWLFLIFTMTVIGAFLLIGGLVIWPIAELCARCRRS